MIALLFSLCRKVDNRTSRLTSYDSGAGTGPTYSSLK